MEPRRLGKYQLIRKLAAGGMAEIYLAKVSGLQGFEKLVVVKRILPQLAQDNQFIQMFLDEARIAATLQHPNIVQMYDIGSVEDDYFISMEYVHGEDVRSIMRRLKKLGRPLPLDQAINLVIGIAAGLHYAHEKVGFDGKPLGIVHRDINPQNVIVTYDGGVKVVDFGIAKASNRLNTETRHGTLKGKIPYMSPEQCEGKVLDRRSDVYAIGIMLYELTTGTRLYRGESDFEIMKQIVEHPVIPPSSRKQPYPLELEQIVMKALNKTLEPVPGAFPLDYRYQTAQELQADLEAFAREEKLVVSTIALSRFMNEIFADRIDAWQQASDDEKLLAEVLAEKMGSSGTGDRSGSGRDLDVLDESELEEVAEDEGFGATVSSKPTPLPTPTTRGEVVSAADEARVGAFAEERRRSPLALVAALGALVVLGVVGVVWVLPAMTSSKGGTEEAPPASSATETPETAVPSPEAQPVVAPVASTGSVEVASEPAGAAIFVDGELWGATTPTRVDGLTPGSHTLKVSLPDHEARLVEVTVAAGGAEKVEVALDPVAPPVAVADGLGEPRPGDRVAKRPPKRPVKRPKGKEPGPKKPPAEATVSGTGTLRVASEPSCEVIVDGKARGSTPIARIELSAGKHRVQLINSRFGIDRTYTVEIKPNEVTKRRYTFPIEGN